MTEREMSTEDIASASTRTEDEPSVMAEPAGMAEPAPGEGQAGDGARGTDAPLEPLLPHGEEDEFLTKWKDIQAAFVDDPRQALTEADALVAGLMKRLAEMFSDARGQLEGQWDRGDEVSTEDQRVTLQRYRSFFTRLLRA
jgi:hypothetical protein